MPSNTKDYDFPLLKTDVTQLVQEAVRSTLEGNAYDHKKVCLLCDAGPCSLVRCGSRLELPPGGDFCFSSRTQVNDWTTNVAASCIDDLRKLSTVRVSVCHSSMNDQRIHWMKSACLSLTFAAEFQVHRHVLCATTQGCRARASQVNAKHAEHKASWPFH